MKIQKIEITGLWHEKDFLWELNPDVNILVGGNGTGKTTILDLSCSVIPPNRMRPFMSQKADKVKLVFDNGYKIECVNFRDSFTKLKEKASEDPSYKEMFEDISEDIGKRRHKQDFGISASFTEFYHNNKSISPKELANKVKVDVISTFDNPLPTDDDESSSFKELKDERPVSHLDKKIYDVMERYSYYIGKLANTIENQVFTQKEITEDFITNVYSQKHLFGKIMNELFKESGKTIDLTKSKPEFALRNGDHISIYDLSSGEKQLLYIMLKVLLQEKEDMIMFLDEPELSLHVDWQETLIDKIQELNPNCQLIIATHSPSLLFHGWDLKVSNIASLFNK